MHPTMPYFLSIFLIVSSASFAYHNESNVFETYESCDEESEMDAGIEASHRKSISKSVSGDGRP